MTISGSIHGAANGGVLLSLWLSDSLVYMNHIFFLPSFAKISLSINLVAEEGPEEIDKLLWF